MLNKIKNRKQEGFTIIEVLIVLAIAGLIMVIVFLAVPALQRNSKNTQRKNDVSALATAIANFTSNNNGALPTAVGNVTADAKSGAVYCNGASPTGITAKTNVTYAAANCKTNNPNYEQAKFGSYDPTVANINLSTTATTPTVVATSVTNSATSINNAGMIIKLGYKCDGASPIVGDASPRSASIFYVLDNGSNLGGTLVCQDV